MSASADTESRRHEKHATATLGELAERFDCRLRGEPGTVISKVGTLSGADDSAISFLANPHYKSRLTTTRAAAVILDESAAENCPTACLISTNPYATYARIAAFLNPPPHAEPGVHASAVVATTARIGAGVSVGAHVAIGEGAVIGDDAYIGPGSVIGADVQVGAGTRLTANVTLCHGVRLGARCIVNPGAVVGGDGFGFAREAQRWVKVPQLGRVRIGNDVEIGANSTIDRGTIEDTVIEDGVKMDNFVQIGHNVRVGEHSIIAGYSGAGGSTKIGKRCLIGGVVKIVGHIEICDDAVFLFGSFVLRSVTTPGEYGGSLSVEDVPSWRRNAARFRQLDEMATRLRRLERALAKLERGD